MSNNILEVNNLVKSFGDNKAVDQVSFNVERGEIFGFLGPNGAGKTTTIRILLGLIFPDQGQVKINGYDINTDFKGAIAKVGAVVETPAFYTYLTGYQNLKLMANLHKDIGKERVEEVLKIVGLEKRGKDKVKTYSLGMKQRLGIARALLNRPDLIILDEPTNGLDPQGIKEVREMIKRLATEEGITFFISTHLLHEVEQVCNKVAILKEGQIITSGFVKELLDRNHEIIEICTPQIEKTAQELKNLEYARLIKESSQGLIVELEKGMSGELNKLLINQQIEVNYLIPKNPSLEEFFIEITEGGNQIA